MKVSGRDIGRWLLAVFMIVAGTNHFRDPAVYLAMMPPFLPVPTLLNMVAGVAEIAGGLGLRWRPTRRWAGRGLIALLVAVFPANIYCAVAEVTLPGTSFPAWVWWARLPFQVVFIFWVNWASQDPAPGRD